MKQIFSLYSYIFHPLFISFYTILFHTSFSSEFNNSNNYIYKAFIITIFIPLIIFYLLIRIKKIENSMINNVKERKIPLTLQLVLYSIIIFSLINPEKNPELLDYFLASSISTLIALYFATLNKKISLHMLSIVSTSLWIGLNYTKVSSHILLIIILTTLISCVAISRLVMKAHTPIELVLGSIIGAFPQLIFFLSRESFC
ncbi:hypothetical protein [Flavobacterium columnare]|uniref:Phosphatidic acid phosphatase type 2/haloperoxidase domain-containing protein n=1 Tax=Flavobacterium columnare TaxID=996 RepID=A0AAI8CHA9_9FLAO|nr:hypothetical protein [Flavobacterium columnare]AMO20164.1 hypothetical protein UN65_07290 [Flavobacterium columnare]MEB3801049.1 hypothetical protein [Flavobacterium columnare]QOG57186.1 hypothetical protein HUE29_07365 [Flavobacterium columnare]QOG59910.1 hypothetical protein HUE30_07365 [Flavobacterium columnare]QOG62630.1 hypothetical protein HUE31_07365 [Flavobacterium columnare]